MARIKNDASLQSRDARRRLKQRREPYWRTIHQGLALGYRRNANGGTWLARHYAGSKQYDEERIGNADDHADANGLDVLSFAQAQLAAIEASTRRGRTESGADCTVAEAIADYIAFLRTERKSGDDAAMKLKAYVPDELARTRLSDLTPNGLEQWRDGMLRRKRRFRGKARKPPKPMPDLTAEQQRDRLRRRKATANRVINYLKAALNRAYRLGKAESPGAWARLLRYRNTDSSRVRWLTVDESRRLLNACEPDLRSLVHAALLTGCRQGELLAMTGRDYDVRSKQVYISESKSGKPRAVPLTDEGCALLAALAAGRERRPLFTRTDGAAWHRVEIGRALARALAGAGIAPLTFHELRHTFASQLIQRGVSLIYVAAALGHSDGRMVTKHYGHLAPSHFADTIRANVPILVDVPVEAIQNVRSCV